MCSMHMLAFGGAFGNFAFVILPFAVLHFCPVVQEVLSSKLKNNWRIIARILWRIAKDPEINFTFCGRTTKRTLNIDGTFVVATHTHTHLLGGGT